MTGEKSLQLIYLHTFAQTLPASFGKGVLFYFGSKHTFRGTRVLPLGRTI